MSIKRTYKDYIFLIIKGIAMGAANKVPGVSGGVVAFVTGFYEEFIYSLQKFNKKALALMYRRRFRLLFEYVNIKFLGFLILGMIISYFSVSKLLDYFMSKNEQLVWATFFGMIIGSVYYIFKDFKGWNRVNVIVCFIGLLIGGSISFLTPATENTNLFFVFFCGMISVVGMTLPGLSGSFLLVLMGNYVLLLIDSVNALYDTLLEVFIGDFSFFDDELRINMLVILILFTFGSLIGMVFFSQLLSFLLKKFNNKTIAVIIGFIMGSLGVIWPWKEQIYKTNGEGEILFSRGNRPILEKYERFIPNFASLDTHITLLFMLMGIGIIFALEWYGKKNRK